MKKPLLSRCFQSISINTKPTLPFSPYLYFSACYYAEVVGCFRTALALFKDPYFCNILSLCLVVSCILTGNPFTNFSPSTAGGLVVTEVPKEASSLTARGIHFALTLYLLIRSHHLLQRLFAFVESDI